MGSRSQVLRAILLAALAAACTEDPPNSADQRSPPAGSQGTATVERGGRLALALGFIRDDGERPTFVPLEHSTILRSGTQLRLALRYDGTCHAYVFHSDNHGALDVLHRPPSSAGASGDQTYVVLPEGSVLDGRAGIEAIHVIASEHPLVTLERLIAESDAAAEDAKPAARSALWEEITRLRATHEHLDRRAEIPGTIGGHVRGDALELTWTAYRFSDAISLTFTIDHR